ncbi:MAG: 50S ribosomal protein L15 [PS1 clade bacterium]|uniref:Large ribosomal subunit protein uL15 n=1 Tax=PS1 clade bacterium TaxID=2175152 RepID=A0A368EHT9_9PROT|nr:MAG: 50S ribosomal protein L15 [PS1 clade bacterium]|tara:strand:+ start:250 stop:873 length:624 start_codon:yes stop_codon:yes gene_type:complete
MRLNELRDNQGARKTRVRVGRGTSSGKGKTGGRGVKGQKSRSGVSIKGFEGGQMPLHMRLPKRGFNVPNPKKLNAVNLGRLQQALDAGKLNASDAVNTANLKIAGVIRRELDGVRIIGNGELKTKLDFEVFGVSASAREAIEKLGGKITVLAPAPSEGDDEAKAEKKAKKNAAKKAEADVEETASEEEAPVEETASDDTDTEDNQSE